MQTVVYRDVTEQIFRDLVKASGACNIHDTGDHLQHVRVHYNYCRADGSLALTFREDDAQYVQPALRLIEERLSPPTRTFMYETHKSAK